YLNEKGITHEYAEYPGEHNWAYWDEHVEESLQFVLAAMNPETLTVPITSGG
ncbi:MAG: hypothetical protein H7145_19160, partial [Akkermansiaceae bacterium]|nr:hypothetical protein [Armatimonadota bacterium]